MKTNRFVASIICLLALYGATACSPARDQAAPTASPGVIHFTQTPLRQPTPSPQPTTTLWAPPRETITPAAAASLTVDEQIAQLLQDYQLALDKELATGDTVMVKNDDGTQQKMLQGKSKEKMDALWAETSAKIDALKARPAADRQHTIDLLAARFGETVQYMETTGLPFYSQTARIEVYHSARMEYMLDIASQQIIEMQPLPVGNPSYHTTPRLAPAELEQRARQIIASIGANLNLSTLTPDFGNKTDTFFFRWEDRSRSMPDGEARFVQVGYSAAGDFLNYYNTLPLP